MGYSRVVVNSETNVTFQHQLDADGTAYAEDISIALQPGVNADRLSYYRNMEGKIGYASVSFSPADVQDPDSIKFPER